MTRLQLHIRPGTWMTSEEEQQHLEVIWIVLEERTTSLAELLSVQNHNELRLSVSPNRYTCDRKRKRRAVVKIGEVTSGTSESIHHTQLGDGR